MLRVTRVNEASRRHPAARLQTSLHPNRGGRAHCLLQCLIDWMRRAQHRKRPKRPTAVSCSACSQAKAGYGGGLRSWCHTNRPTNNTTPHSAAAGASQDCPSSIRCSSQDPRISPASVPSTNGATMRPGRSGLLGGWRSRRIGVPATGGQKLVFHLATDFQASVDSGQFFAFHVKCGIWRCRQPASDVEGIAVVLA